MNQIIETTNLILKQSEPSLAQMVTEYCIKNRAFLSEWEPNRDEEFYTLDFQKKQLEDDIKTTDILRFYIFKKEDPEKIIGTIAFTNIVRGVFLSCYMGYKLDEDELNKGYMTEAIVRATDIVFHELKLHRIEANVMPRNVRSIRVLEKSGFQNEGYSPKYLKIKGVWEDHIHMVLLNESESL